MLGLDIKMPKDCEHCPCWEDYGNGICNAICHGREFTREEEKFSHTRRMDWCPLIDLDRKED